MKMLTRSRSTSTCKKAIFRIILGLGIVNFKVIDSVKYNNDCTKGEFIHTYTECVPDIVGFSLKQTLSKY